MIQDHADTAATIRSLVAAQDAWRARTLNMVASENALSPASRALLATDLAGRVAMSITDARPFPSLRAMQHIAPLWRTFLDLAGQLLGAEFVDPRPQSVTQANFIAMAAVASRGDVIAVQGTHGGGSESYNEGALPDYLGLSAVILPSTPDMGIDVDGAAAVIREHRPRAIVLGGMKVLFPYPIRELRALADEVGATIIFDAAHLVPLIATDLFQRPLADGAHIITAGTHKMAGGPMGGLLGTNDADLAARLEAVTEVFVEGRDMSGIMASAHAFAELAAFAEPYSAACITNARALAVALEAKGYPVLGAARGYTQTHQVAFDVSRHGSAFDVLDRCAERDLFLSVMRLSTDDPYPATPHGIRISTQELTRHGFEPADMAIVADLVDRAARDADTPEAMRAEVGALMDGHQEMRFVLG